ncbi:MAG: tetratricopeptide repeat protein [Proteobacteria bacterium]|nr:tetratricopeptide repeat protein [Pseudomonadota bacterium]
MTADRNHFNAGIAALEARDLDAAATAFEQALAADPNDTEARYRLANAYRDLRRLDEAEHEMREVVAVRPTDAKARSALGVILTESGRPAEAVQIFAEAMAVDPMYGQAAANWLHTQQYVPNTTDESLARNHAHWAALHAPPAPRQDFANPPTQDRPIVVGFVSGEFGQHPVGRLSVQLFENLRPHEIRPCVFSTRPAEFEDEISRRIARVTRWTSVFGLSDASLAQFIQASKVDILIDVSGHTGAGRPNLFVRRAAPVQAAWLGYPSTTGIPAMDYLLTTGTLAPPGFERFANERILRLTSTHACFEAPDAPPVAARPAARNGYITFGCFNNPAKISDDAIASFAAILKRVPSSRLKIQYQALRAPGLVARLHAKFEAHGIARGRVDLSAETSQQAFLSGYNDVDIALDSFPYSGCMTTCEALWMGCPVVTFAGETMTGRQAASILAAAGLSEFVARDRADFEDMAVSLANDAHRLTILRTGLRTILARAPLCDGDLFAREFTRAARTMWTDWCGRASA